MVEISIFDFVLIIKCGVFVQSWIPDMEWMSNVMCCIIFLGPKIFTKHQIEVPSETLKYPNMISPSVLTLTDWLMVNANQAYNWPIVVPGQLIDPCH